MSFDLVYGDTVAYCNKQLGMYNTDKFTTSSSSSSTTTTKTTTMALLLLDSHDWFT